MESGHEQSKSLLKKAEAFKNTHEGCKKEDQKIRLKDVEGKNRKKTIPVVVKQCQKEYERQNRRKKNVVKKICGRKSKLGVKGRIRTRTGTKIPMPVLEKRKQTQMM
jgi:hypothetical protein